MQCRNSGLCLFDDQPVQSDIIGHSISELNPLTSEQTNGPLEFVFPQLPNEYIDFSDFNIKVKFKILQADGKDIEDAHKVGLNNLPICTLFRDVSLYLNDTLVEGGQMNYAYKAYFNVMSQFHPAAQKSHMAIQGWCKDEAGKFDDPTNKGFVSRMKLTKDSKVCELMGPLRLDFFNQSRYLLGDVRMRLKLTLNDPKFLLNAYGSVSDFKISMIDATILYRRVELNPSVRNGHVQGLMKQNAEYPIQHSKFISHVISQGHMDYQKSNLFPGSTPKVLMVVMLDTQAFNGHIQKNPFNFQHYNLQQMLLYVDDRPYPTTPYTPDFSTESYVRDYHDYMKVMGYVDSDDTNGMTYEEYGKGYTVYAFDLTPDADITAPYRHAKLASNLKIDLKWKKPLPTAISVGFYALCDSKVEIGRYGDIILEYNR